MRLDPQPPFSVGVVTKYEYQREAQTSFAEFVFYRLATIRPARPDPDITFFCI